MRTFLCPFPCKNQRIEGIPRALVFNKCTTLKYEEDFQQPSWFYYVKLSTLKARINKDHNKDGSGS